jgi:uncharacterized protein YmfQ (DUF2313 family)
MLIEKVEWDGELKNLLPTGIAWDYDEGSNTDLLIKALESELERAEHSAVDLFYNILPDSTTTLLEDWERICGLPDSCTQFVEFNADERRENVVAKLNETGGQSRAYYLNIANKLGYPDAEIVEYEPTRIGDDIDNSLWDESWVFVWDMVNTGIKIVEAKIGASFIGDPIRRWGNEALECAISQNAPAHTLVRFVYLESVSEVITLESGEEFLLEAGDDLITE